MGGILLRKRTALAQLLGAGATLLVLAIALPPSADAYIYWGHMDLGVGSIGRADNDGTNPNPLFITGLKPVTGIAVDSGHIYWAESDGNAGTANDTIGRANIDGTGADSNFITSATDGPQPGRVAVNASHVYWTQTGAAGKVWREKIDASNAKFAVITGASNPTALALGDTFLYSTNFNANAIGRANLDGSSPNATFIASASEPLGLTADSNYLYWSRSTGKIGRVLLNSTSPDATFISADGLSKPDIEAFGGDLYWVTSNGSNSVVGKASANGSSVTPSLIPAGGTATAIAVDALATPVNPPPPPPTPPEADPSLALGKLERKTKNGTAKLSVTVSGAGSLSVKGKLLVTKRKQTAAAGTFKLFLKPRGRAVRSLAEKGKVRLSATVTFTPSGKDPIERRRTVKLVRKLPG